MKNKMFVYQTHIFFINTFNQGNKVWKDGKKNDLHDIWPPGSDMKNLSVKKLKNICTVNKLSEVYQAMTKTYILH